MSGAQKCIEVISWLRTVIPGPTCAGWLNIDECENFFVLFASSACEVWVADTQMSAEQCHFLFTKQK